MKQKTGLILFWISVIWTFAWGILGSICQNEFFGHELSLEEFNQSAWAIDGPIMMIWGFATPLGILVAGIGILLYSNAKGSTAWKYTIGIILGVFLSFLIGSLGHIPILFAIGATLILLFFFRILWLWAEERVTVKGKLATAADLKLTGYVFMLIGMWYTCGIAGPPWINAFMEQPPMMDPIIVMTLFVLGWLFLLLSHYNSRPQKEE
ncbi:MAG: hypothetical protein ISR57_01925 [Bacteroidales bacterium]|nr:hypothetical protein [Bacteroidota bacterium]MBL6949378.1 hypothetical protein [Bacteroidales bacterium]